VYSYLINLKKTYPAFRSNDFTLAVNGALKRINISHASMNVSIIGNFNVTAGTIAGNFNSTGLWYDYFSGNSINVTDPYAQMTLQPGEFHIYTNVKLPTPEPGLITDVAEYHADQIPTHYLLEQNYPNPFNPTTAIKFNLPEKTNVSLVIYDQLGEKVTTLINGALSAGYHQVEWDASNMTSGIYFYEIKTNNFSAVKKLILMK
jgi:hypothetical protein